MPVAKLVTTVNAIKFLQVWLLVLTSEIIATLVNCPYKGVIELTSEHFHTSAHLHVYPTIKITCEILVIKA